MSFRNTYLSPCPRNNAIQWLSLYGTLWFLINICPYNEWAYWWCLTPRFLLSHLGIPASGIYSKYGQLWKDGVGDVSDIITLLLKYCYLKKNVTVSLGIALCLLYFIRLFFCKLLPARLIWKNNNLLFAMGSTNT